MKLFQILVLVLLQKIMNFCELLIWEPDEIWKDYLGFSFPAEDKLCVDSWILVKNLFEILV